MDPDAKGAGGLEAVIEGDVQVAPRLVAENRHRRAANRGAVARDTEEGVTIALQWPS